MYLYKLLKCLYSVQAYVSELEKFLSQAQHPKTVDLLKKALDKNKQNAVSHQQPAAAPVQPVRAKPKTDKPATYFVPIDTYGKPAQLYLFALQTCGNESVTSVGLYRSVLKQIVTGQLAFMCITAKHIFRCYTQELCCTLTNISVLHIFQSAFAITYSSLVRCS